MPGCLIGKRFPLPSSAFTNKISEETQPKQAFNGAPVLFIICPCQRLGVLRDNVITSKFNWVWRGFASKFSLFKIVALICQKDTSFSTFFFTVRFQFSLLSSLSSSFLSAIKYVFCFLLLIHYVVCLETVHMAAFLHFCLKMISCNIKIRV